MWPDKKRRGLKYILDSYNGYIKWRYKIHDIQMPLVVAAFSSRHTAGAALDNREPPLVDKLWNTETKEWPLMMFQLTFATLRYVEAFALVGSGEGDLGHDLVDLLLGDSQGFSNYNKRDWNRLAVSVSLSTIRYYRSNSKTPLERLSLSKWRFECDYEGVSFSLDFKKASVYAGPRSCG